MEEIKSAKALAALCRELESAAGRRRLGLWMVEGTKGVLDSLGHFPLSLLAATPAWLEQHRDRLGHLSPLVLPERDMDRASRMKAPQGVIAVFERPFWSPEWALIASGLSLALDAIQDPGNLGTIIRTADWFGVHDIIASADTADCFGPKVVQATMGALARVRVHYADDLAATLSRLDSLDAEVCGMDLAGEDITRIDPPARACIVIGNEGRGLSPAVRNVLTRKITLPPWPPQVATHGESLNAAVAAAITLAQFRYRSSLHSSLHSPLHG